MRFKQFLKVDYNNLLVSQKSSNKGLSTTSLVFIPTENYTFCGILRLFNQLKIVYTLKKMRFKKVIRVPNSAVKTIIEVHLVGDKWTLKSAVALQK